MIAVIETGGKQYLVSPKTKLQIDKLVAEAGGTLEFDKILLIADEKGMIEIGAPMVDAKVTATVERQLRTRKILVRKFKNKTRYHRTHGHRQHKTEITVETIK